MTPVRKIDGRNFRRMGQDMCIGDDVSLGIDDEPAAGGIDAPLDLPAARRAEELPKVVKERRRHATRLHFNDIDRNHGR